MSTPRPAPFRHPLAGRTSGVLLHPTSLPGPFGIGDLGPAAYAWVDALAEAGQSWWQVLPLGPTGYGDSPYQSFSAFAGNVNLISPELLVEDGLLPPDALRAVERPNGSVDYEWATEGKRVLVERAWSQSPEDAIGRPADDWDRFRTENAGWLD